MTLRREQLLHSSMDAASNLIGKEENPPVIDYTQPDTENIPTVGDIEKPLSPKNLSNQQAKKQPPPAVLRHLIMNEHRNRASALETPSESRARQALTAISSPTHNPRKVGLAIEARHIDPKRLLHQE